MVVTIGKSDTRGNLRAVLVGGRVKWKKKEKGRMAKRDGMRARVERDHGMEGVERDREVS